MPTEQLSIATELVQGKEVCLVHLSGELDAHTFLQLEVIINDLLDGDCRKLILDCTDLRYISSAGAGVLVCALGDVEGRGGRLVLMAANDRICNVLDLLGLKELFPIVTSMTGALAAINDSKARQATVLVVDDDPDIREALGRSLELDGYPVFAAESVASALKLIGESPPKVILLDYFLPGEHAREVVAMVRQKHLPTSIILITAARCAREKADELGLKYCLGKPLDYDQLLNTIRTCSATA